MDYPLQPEKSALMSTLWSVYISAHATSEGVIPGLTHLHGPEARKRRK